MSNPTRICAKCGVSPEFAEFKKDKRAKDGLGAYCVECQKEYAREYYEANKAKLNEVNNARYHANRDETLAKQREYRDRNVERIREYDRQRYQENPVARRAHTEKWVSENRDRYLASKRRYHITNRDRMMDTQAKNRLRVAGFDAPFEPIIRRDVWELSGRSCGICGQELEWELMELDHIYPISKGGGHLYSNVQPAHRSCNAKKSDKITT